MSISSAVGVFSVDFPIGLCLEVSASSEVSWSTPMILKFGVYLLRIYLYSNSTNSFQLRINAALGVLISESGFVISWVFKFEFTGGEVSLIQSG
ncbi:hypothetical protein OUZ56_021428 [Daphnia magna]|uniref:Uncharacterized protein n=1 Tax=Daphnia magna TaxID=35525 RepID=A0ABQ9ZHB6_9CRUS|nr:hypothetical protein OUZ56_021428 [Daphnia magna]